MGPALGQRQPANRFRRPVEEVMPVELVYQDEVALLTLDNPPVNSLSGAVLADLARAASKAMSDDLVRVLVVTGKGSGFFAAGADLKELAGFDASSGARAVKKAKEALEVLRSGPKPVCAAINGLAAGGGLELALSCDFRVCADSARLGLPEVKLGVMPGAGGSQVLPRLIGPGAAAALMMTGELIQAERAMQLGLVDQVVAGDQLLPSAIELAAGLARMPPLALAHIKAAVLDAITLPLDQGLEKETNRFADLCRTEDKQEGVRAFFEKRAPSFQGR